MSKLVKSEYENDLVYNIDYLVEKDEYQTWRQKLINQILSTVEVTGFRKGKAPDELAMKQLNLKSVEETILQETISKFGTQALQEAKDKLKNESRVVQNQTIDFNLEHTGPSEDGFKFRLVLSLLPKIDLSGLEKIQEPQIEKDDLPPRLSKAEFIAKEESKFLASLNEYQKSEEVSKMNDKIQLDLVEVVKGQDPRDLKDVTYTLGVSELPEEFVSELIGVQVGQTKNFDLKVPASNGSTNKGTSVKYTITVKDLQSPKHSDIQALLDNSAEAKKQFETREKFNDFLVNYYDQESKAIEEDLKKRKIIEESLQIVPDFSLPIDKTEAEQDRIMQVMQDQVKNSGQSLGQVFKQSGIERDTTKNIEDPIEIKKIVSSYVSREFKWIFILRSIYEFKVEEKISNEQIDTVSAEMQKKPREYNLQEGQNSEYYREIAYDRLMRSKSTTWLFNLASSNTTK
ncbi:MAG: trigger factor [Patescibacteria group bacterium]